MVWMLHTTKYILMNNVVIESWHEIISARLALCEGNPSVIGAFLSIEAGIRSSDAIKAVDQTLDLLVISDAMMIIHATSLQWHSKSASIPWRQNGLSDGILMSYVSEC